MEYLMTYGWAILIIAVVLGALFSLGVFSGTSLLGTTCIASSGYYCSNLVYSHTNNQITATIGQSTGATYYGVGIAYAPQGTNTITGGIPSVTFSGIPTSSNTLASGQTVTVSLTVGSAPVAVGTTTAGSIWLAYSTSSSASGTLCTGSASSISSSCQFTQIATLTAKAT
jgi:hypothetical protein